MDAKELFKSGNLLGTIEQLTLDVKNKPLDLSSRIFLFETLCFAAEYARAERQLDAIATTSGDVKVELGVQVYKTVLEAEKKRAAFFTGSQSAPKFFSEPPACTALHLKALSSLRADNVEEVEQWLQESAALRQPATGTRDGTPFSDLRDADDILAPFLEVFFQGEYCWLPFTDVHELHVNPPATLRDLLWIPAQIVLHTGPLGDVFLPVQYYGSAKHEDDLVKLGRMTDWKSVGEKTLVGMGQRTFLLDEAECPVLEIRKVEFYKSA